MRGANKILIEYQEINFQFVFLLFIILINIKYITPIEMISFKKFFVIFFIYHYYCQFFKFYLSSCFQQRNTYIHYSTDKNIIISIIVENQPYCQYRSVSRRSFGNFKKILKLIELKKYHDNVNSLKILHLNCPIQCTCHVLAIY